MAIDVTDLPHAVSRGDRAEILGPNILIDEAAGWAGTISYELLTRLGSRYAKLYSELDSGPASLNPLQPIGRAVLALLAEIGRVSLFLKDAVVQGLTPTYYVRQIFEQMWRIGYNSLPVVGLTAFFTGGALALQIYQGSTPGTASTLVPNIVALGITRELGPVLAGLMVAGRVGASIAAELGTMRVTEQIDALVTLSTNAFKYLVGPRLIAAVITLPILVAIGDTIGIMGGYIVGTRSLGFNSYAYHQNHSGFSASG